MKRSKSRISKFGDAARPSAPPASKQLFKCFLCDSFRRLTEREPGGMCNACRAKTAGVAPEAEYRDPGDDFHCCGGNDETPTDHCMDCPDHGRNCPRHDGEDATAACICKTFEERNP